MRVLWSLTDYESLSRLFSRSVVLVSQQVRFLRFYRYLSDWLYPVSGLVSIQFKFLSLDISLFFDVSLPSFLSYIRSFFLSFCRIMRFEDLRNRYQFSQSGHSAPSSELLSGSRLITSNSAILRSALGQVRSLAPQGINTPSFLHLFKASRALLP